MSTSSRRRFGFTLVELPVVSTRKRNAFTLVELLVVITIIGMLVALLLPAVNAVRKNAQQTQCTNNQKNLALALVNYDSSKGGLPGYAQYVSRSPDPANPSVPAWIKGNNATGTMFVESATDSSVPYSPEDAKAWGVSWGVMILSRIEQQAYWDQLVDGSITQVPIKPIDTFRCPSDSEVQSQKSLGALSFSANTGAWDMNQSGDFLLPPNKGDVAKNGVFFNRTIGGPQTRLSGLKDGTNLTIMLTENIHKDYANPTYPLTWLSGTEQQVGVVWVAPQTGTTPTPGNNVDQQELINRVADNITSFDPTKPRFARPASNHGEGAVVAFCDGHCEFLREDIDYLTYQRLLTTDGRKCEDPRAWQPDVSATATIKAFRTAPPLTESDFR